MKNVFSNKYILTITHFV